MLFRVVFLISVLGQPIRSYLEKIKMAESLNPGYYGSQVGHNSSSRDSPRGTFPPLPAALPRLSLSQALAAPGLVKGITELGFYKTGMFPLALKDPKI